MNILLVSQYFVPEVGAPQIRLFEICKALLAKGNKVTVVTGFPNYPSGVIPGEYRGHLFYKEKTEGLNIIRTWIYPYRGGGVFHRLLNYFSFTFSSILGSFRAGRCDLILVESPPLFLGLSAWLISLYKRAPFIFIVSDLWPESVAALGIIRNQPLLKMAERLEIFIYRRAWKIAAVTEGIRERLTARGFGGKVTFLPNGVNTDVFLPKAPDPGLAGEIGVTGKFVAIYAGILGHAQGLETVLQAASQVLEFPDIMFLFIGDGPEKRDLQETAKKLKLTNVRFVEPVPFTKMPEYFALSSVSVVPLRKLELFKGARPSKMFPAMSCSRPIIFCGEGEAARLVNEAKCGNVVQPEDPQALAQAIINLYKNPDLVKTMGENGRRFVKMHYSWNPLLGRWWEELGLTKSQSFTVRR